MGPARPAHRPAAGGACPPPANTAITTFLTHPGKLARELWDEGIRAMKIWPFDRAAEATRGLDATRRDLGPGLAIVEAIRDQVDLDMDLLIELHGLWTRPAAAKIAHALAPYHPY